MATREHDFLVGRYPYDFAECRRCATMHASKSGVRCDEPKHEEMRAGADELNIVARSTDNLTPELHERVLEFRKKFARFYPAKEKA